MISRMVCQQGRGEYTGTPAVPDREPDENASEQAVKFRVDFIDNRAQIL